MKKTKTCFVIMGYGVKTNFDTGRDLDLDKTYKNIIKPAAEAAGLECKRADEIKHSGIIDVPMYRELINADVVIADLSTSNSNAFYELGVRHALRPQTTIAIAENNLKPPFDVNHTVIHKYEHLGTDIGYSEVLRFKKELTETIEEVLKTQDIDSPVYTYLNNLKPPILESVEDNKAAINNKESNKTLSEIIEKAIKHMNEDEFTEAKTMFKYANEIDPNNEYILQKLTLATYKSKSPTHVKALNSALEIMDLLNFETTNNPETLGLAGAIYKRLWEELKDEKYLEKSILYYEKGFYIKNDYYNGINLAYLYNVKSNIQHGDEAIADKILAKRIRKKVIKICEKLYEEDSFKDRSDKYWILATLEEAYFGIGDSKNYKYYKEQSKSLVSDNWERETTDTQILKLNELLIN